MGRERSDSSPVNTAVVGVVAIAPMTRREPVPELPKSSTSSGSDQPPTPVPQTVHSPAPRRVTWAPKRRIASAVFRTSSASKRPVMRVSPTVSAPRISARWEMDLSPGIAAVPRSGPDRRDFRGLVVSEPLIFKSKSLFDRPLKKWQTTRLPTQPFLYGKQELGQGRSRTET